MERLLECSVCLERYDSGVRKPLILPCGHTVCQTCCQTHVAQDRFCPMCRHPVTTPITDLQVNYALICDLQPTATGGSSLQPQQREQVRSAVNQLLASLEVDKAAVASVQLQCRTMHQNHQSARQRLCSALESAANSLLETAKRYRLELSDMDQANEAQLQGELKQWEDRIQAKLQAVTDLSAMLADKVPFSPEKVVEVETQLARQNAGPSISMRTLAVPQDINTRVTGLVEELTSRSLNIGVVQVSAKAEPQGLAASSMSSMSSMASDGGRRKGGKRDSEPRPERPRKERPEKPDRNAAMPALEIPQRGGPSEGAKWLWLKNDNQGKPFYPEECTQLEQAFQAGAKEHSLMNPKGGVGFVVDFERFLGYKNGKGKPRRIARTIDS